MPTLNKNLGKGGGVRVVGRTCGHRSPSSEGCVISLGDCSKNCEVSVREHLSNPTNYSWSVKGCCLENLVEVQDVFFFLEKLHVATGLFTKLKKPNLDSSGL